MKLLVISHTEHYLNNDNKIVGWGPTIKELDYLATIFEQVIHAAPLYQESAPSSALAYEQHNITFVSLMPSGGNGLKAKFKVLQITLKNIRIIHNLLKDVDFFQFRAPTGMGVLLIPYLIFYTSKTGWFKYAGNWMEEKAAWSYKFQRFCLTYLTNKPVTINGKWPNQKKHLFTFDNPCLSEDEILDGKNLSRTKSFENKINFIFVGKLIDSKGVQRILDAFALIPKNHPKLGRLILIGDGQNIQKYKKFALDHCIGAEFKGFMPKERINLELKSAHVLLLPSDSEGFPKVVAEGINYNCIPIVSNVSCLDQYIQSKVNGILLVQNNKQYLMDAILWILNQSPTRLTQMANEGRGNVEKFSYLNYLSCIKKTVLNLEQ
jgi:glycosyltransferase involved in cell wall biosynthesis